MKRMWAPGAPSDWGTVVDSGEHTLGVILVKGDWSGVFNLPIPCAHWLRAAGIISSWTSSLPCVLAVLLLSMNYLQGESQSEVTQSCPTLCNPMDWSLPGSSAHGIFQAIVLEWIAISFSRGSSRPRDRAQVSLIVDRRFTVWATGKSWCPQQTGAHSNSPQQTEGRPERVSVGRWQCQLQRLNKSTSCAQGNIFKCTYYLTIYHRKNGSKWTPICREMNNKM